MSAMACFRQLSRLLSQPGFPLWIIFRSVRDPDNLAAQTTSVRTGSFASSVVVGCVYRCPHECVGLEGRGA
jgi:hypothetical protein